MLDGVDSLPRELLSAMLHSDFFVSVWARRKRPGSPKRSLHMKDAASYFGSSTQSWCQIVKLIGDHDPGLIAKELLTILPLLSQIASHCSLYFRLGGRWSRIRDRRRAADLAKAVAKRCECELNGIPVSPFERACENSPLWYW